MLHITSQDNRTIAPLPVQATQEYMDMYMSITLLNWEYEYNTGETNLRNTMQDHRHAHWSFYQAGTSKVNLASDEFWYVFRWLDIIQNGRRDLARCRDTSSVMITAYPEYL